MRHHELRIWDTENKCWKSDSATRGYYFCHRPKELIMTDYIGLKDCNEKKIFIGDILLYTATDQMMKDMLELEEHLPLNKYPRQMKVEVVFKDGMYTGKSDAMIFIAPLHKNIDDWTMKIIGNIFEGEKNDSSN